MGYEKEMYIDFGDDVIAPAELIYKRRDDYYYKFNGAYKETSSLKFKGDKEHGWGDIILKEKKSMIEELNNIMRGYKNSIDEIKRSLLNVESKWEQGKFAYELSGCNFIKYKILMLDEESNMALTSYRDEVFKCKDGVIYIHKKPAMYTNLSDLNSVANRRVVRYEKRISNLEKSIEKITSFKKTEVSLDTNFNIFMINCWDIVEYEVLYYSKNIIIYGDIYHATGTDVSNIIMFNTKFDYVYLCFKEKVRERIESYREYRIEDRSTRNGKKCYFVYGSNCVIRDIMLEVNDAYIYNDTTRGDPRIKKSEAITSFDEAFKLMKESNKESAESVKEYLNRVEKKFLERIKKIKSFS